MNYSGVSRFFESGQIGPPGTRLSFKREASATQMTLEVGQGNEIRIKEDFAYDKTSVWFQDPGQFLEGGVLVGDFAQHCDQIRAIKSVVGIGQPGGVAHGRHDVVTHGPGGPTHEVVKHLLLDVQHFQSSAGAQRRGNRKCVLARAGTDFEQTLTSSPSSSLSRLDDWKGRGASRAQPIAWGKGIGSRLVQTRVVHHEAMVTNPQIKTQAGLSSTKETTVMAAPALAT